jgi:catechol 2,3-dioxygenase-like lactoylglutathione lyase family enzyme
MKHKLITSSLLIYSVMMLFFILTFSTENIFAQTDTKQKNMSAPNSTIGPAVSVRYIVTDVDSCITFYTKLLGFKVVMHPAPEFAWLSRGSFRLLLSKPSGAGGGGQAMPDGTMPTPGGWNRFQLEVDNLEALVADLKSKNAQFRNEIVNGIGGKQILLKDPSGNLIELFQSTR